MAIFTGFMLGTRKLTVNQFPMTIRTGNSIFGHMQVMAERERETLLFIAARQQQDSHKAQHSSCEN